MLKGIAASSGVVVGKIYKLEHPSFEIKRVNADPETQLKKFDEALEKTRDDILRISKSGCWSVI